MKKITVFYDYDAFWGKIGGVPRCFIENFKVLEKSINLLLFVPFSDNIYLQEYKKVKRFLPWFSFKGKKTLQNSISKILTLFALHTKKYDIFHSTGENTYFLSHLKSHPLVITVHDMIPEETNLSDRVKVRSKLIQNANQIIAVSQYTKNRLLHFYPMISPDKITVIYHGYRIEPKEYTDNKWGDYILYVGGRNGYKNFKRFAQSVSKILQIYNLNLVCTGYPFNKEEKELLLELGILKHTIQIFADEQTLYSLYKYAKVFVYPSIIEGFGIPILEAWDNQCPICISNSSCFPEIAQDAAIYFDPHDEKDMTHAIELILNDEKLRKNLINKGKQYLKEYTWEKSALKLKATYVKLIEYEENSNTNTRS